jgi:hypothetical protein
MHLCTSLEREKRREKLFANDGVEKLGKEAILDEDSRTKNNSSSSEAGKNFELLLYPPTNSITRIFQNEKTTKKKDSMTDDGRGMARNPIVDLRLAVLKGHVNTEKKVLGKISEAFNDHEKKSALNAGSLEFLSKMSAKKIIGDDALMGSPLTSDKSPNNNLGEKANGQNQIPFQVSQRTEFTLEDLEAENWFRDGINLSIQEMELLVKLFSDGGFSRHEHKKEKRKQNKKSILYVDFSKKYFLGGNLKKLFFFLVLFFYPTLSSSIYPFIHIHPLPFSPLFLCTPPPTPISIILIIPPLF